MGLFMGCHSGFYFSSIPVFGSGVDLLRQPPLGGKKVFDLNRSVRSVLRPLPTVLVRVCLYLIFFLFLRVGSSARHWSRACRNARRRC